MFPRIDKATNTSNVHVSLRAAMLAGSGVSRGRYMPGEVGIHIDELIHQWIEGCKDTGAYEGYRSSKTLGEA